MLLLSRHGVIISGRTKASCEQAIIIATESSSSYSLRKIFSCFPSVPSPSCFRVVVVVTQVKQSSLVDNDNNKRVPLVLISCLNLHISLWKQEKDRFAKQKSRFTSQEERINNMTNQATTATGADPSAKSADDSSVTKKNHHLPPENLRPTKLRHISKLASPMGIARGLVNLFSSSTHQRPRPEVDNATDVQHLRFITVGVSHFCEKARWALDLLQAQSLEQANKGENKTVYYYYTEDAHAPPFVSFASVPASGDQASQTPMVIFTDDPSRKVLFGSTIPPFCANCVRFCIRNSITTPL